MSKTRILWFIFLTIFLLAPTLIATSPEIDWWHTGSSGNLVSQGSVQMDGLIGQGLVEITNQGSTQLCSGFLCYAVPVKSYLPLVIKDSL